MLKSRFRIGSGNILLRFCLDASEISHRTVHFKFYSFAFMMWISLETKNLCWILLEFAKVISNILFYFQVKSKIIYNCHNPKWNQELRLGLWVTHLFWNIKLLSCETNQRHCWNCEKMNWMFQELDGYIHKRRNFCSSPLLHFLLLQAIKMRKLAHRMFIFIWFLCFMTWKLWFSWLSCSSHHFARDYDFNYSTGVYFNNIMFVIYILTISNFFWWKIV